MAPDVSEQNKDYGLPKVDPQPIDRGQPGIAKEPLGTDENPRPKDNRTVIIVLSVVGIMILASLLYMIFWDSDSSGTSSPDTSEVQDRAMIDTEADDNAPVPDESPEAPDLEVSEEVVSEEPGSITTISQRTNRYYIFVGSYKFRAYAQRHAELLADDGFSVKLITPDNWVGVRVAVGNYANKEEARGDAQQIRSRYGNEVVISKY
jgi:hypothetical protein